MTLAEQIAALKRENAALRAAPRCPKCGNVTSMSVTYVDGVWTYRCHRVKCNRLLVQTRS